VQQWKAKTLIDVVAVYCRAWQSTGLERENSIEELTDIALKPRERVDLSAQQRYRLVGGEVSNFREAEQTVERPLLFE
jgi:hypothetical protein